MAKAKTTAGKSPASRSSTGVQELAAAKAQLREVNRQMAPFKRAAQEIRRINKAAEAKPKSIFDTPQARAHAKTYTKITGEPSDYNTIANRMFDVILAKQKHAANGVQETRDLDIDEIRAHLFELLGNAGWERTLFFLAQCARLWAELDGPVKFNEGQKDLMHGVSSKLNDMMMDGRAIDRASRGRP
jgi:hypothetical protein